jgi:hypothetical protein
MRTINLLVAGLVLLADRPAAAATIVVEALHSTLTFGQVSPSHLFYDVTLTTCYDDTAAADCGLPMDGDASVVEAFGGTLARQTLRDEGGVVVWSDYEYVGGTVRMDLVLRSEFSPQLTGSFTAPILELRIGAPNASRNGNDPLDPVEYTLGQGRFSRPLAAALHIQPRTSGRGGSSFMRLVPPDRGVGGDHVTPAREAFGGAAYFSIGVRQIPEPSTLMLSACTLFVAWCLRRRSFR